jgi:hypothetical protein
MMNVFCNYPKACSDMCGVHLVGNNYLQYYNTTPHQCRAGIEFSKDETGKTEVPCPSRCGTIKIPPYSKALSAEHRPKFAALHRQW